MRCKKINQTLDKNKPCITNLRTTYLSITNPCVINLCTKRPLNTYDIFFFLLKKNVIS